MKEFECLFVITDGMVDGFNRILFRPAWRWIGFEYSAIEHNAIFISRILFEFRASIFGFKDTAIECYL